jgi:RNA polymerase sigma-70 factor (ECF subfamily)
VENTWRGISDSLRRFIRSQVKDEVLAEDILQDVFMKMAAKLPLLRQEEKISAWLFQIARNTIIDHFRRRDNIAKLESSAPLGNDPAIGGDNATEEFARCIPDMLDTLPPIYREALYWSEIEGLSQKDLAQKLGVPYSTAKSRVQRGKAKLRENLLNCCHITTDVYGNVLDYWKKS